MAAFECWFVATLVLKISQLIDILFIGHEYALIRHDMAGFDDDMLQTVVNGLVQFLHEERNRTLAGTNLWFQTGKSRVHPMESWRSFPKIFVHSCKFAMNETANEPNHCEWCVDWHGVSASSSSIIRSSTNGVSIHCRVLFRGTHDVSCEHITLEYFPICRSLHSFSPEPCNVYKHG